MSTKQPAPTARHLAAARDLANQMHRNFVSDEKNDGTYTLDLDEESTRHFFKYLEAKAGIMLAREFPEAEPVSTLRHGESSGEPTRRSTDVLSGGDVSVPAVAPASANPGEVKELINRLRLWAQDIDLQGHPQNEELHELLTATITALTALQAERDALKAGVERLTALYNNRQDGFDALERMLGKQQHETVYDAVRRVLSDLAASLARENELAELVRTYFSMMGGGFLNAGLREKTNEALARHAERAKEDKQ